MVTDDTAQDGNKNFVRAGRRGRVQHELDGRGTERVAVAIAEHIRISTCYTGGIILGIIRAKCGR